MSMTSSPYVWAGDVIRFKGDLYRIKKVNPKNLVIQNEAGESYNLGRGASYTIADRADFDSTVVDAKAAEIKAVAKVLVPGATVVFTGVSDSKKFSGVYVVCGGTGERRKFARLGGDDGATVSGSVTSVREVQYMGSDEFGYPVWT